MMQIKLENLYGSWRMRTIQIQKDTTLIPFATKTGLLIYDASGNFSLSSQGPITITDSRFAAEAKSLIADIFYAGTYKFVADNHIEEQLIWHSLAERRNKTRSIKAWLSEENLLHHDLDGSGVIFTWERQPSSCLR